MSQHHYWEARDRKKLEIQNRRLAPYRNPASPSPRRAIKSESVSPARTPRLSAIAASKHFSADDQYGVFLNSQIGENTFVDHLCNSKFIVAFPANNVASPSSEKENDASQDTGIKSEPELKTHMNRKNDPGLSPRINKAIDLEPRSHFCVDCARLTDERDAAAHERDMIYDEWHASRAACEKMEFERNAAILERDTAVAERNRLESAAAEYFQVVGVHRVQN
ncbi:hypothetical protein C8R43DRAFT_941734 [Mycena crocata]|nr:hypothetical protein C8R43DRAFT_941734 [Mycena crocata]